MWIGSIEEEEGWMGPYLVDTEVADDDGTDNSTVARFLVAKGKNPGTSDDGENKFVYAQNAGWYFVSLEFTLASLGIWPYDSAR